MATTTPVVFLAFANDRVGGDDGFLRNLNQELKQLKATLTDVEGVRVRGAPRWAIHDVAETTLDDIVSGLQLHRGRVALFHYGGHAGDYQLLLQSPTGARALADAGGLARLLGGQDGLQLVFLNGCSTYGHVEELLAAGVPAVVATRRPIEDALALDFARTFYRGLASGASIGIAFDEAMSAARAALGGDPRASPGTAAPTRDLDVDDGPRAVEERLPWELHVKPGADVVKEWSLAVAAGDPLFGLPALAPRDLPPSPFRHLQWFTRDHAELFFGRGTEIRALHESVTSASAPPIVLLYGQSGAGKSSLLDAGLRPRLEATHDVTYARRDERVGLAATLRRALGVADGTPLGDAWRARETALARPAVVILDQVEEAFSKPHPALPDELEALVAELAALYRDASNRPSGRLVLGFRKEWLAELTKRFGEALLPYQEVFLDRLAEPGIVEIVTGPTRVTRLRDRYHLRIDGESELLQSVVEDMLADRGSAVAPTLQVLLSKMWSHPRARRNGAVVFDPDLYLDLKQTGILLGDFLDEQLALLETSRPGLVDSGLALDLLHAHTTDLATARARTAAELAARYRHHAVDLPAIVGQLVDARLLVDASRAPDDDADRATALAHDTLAPLVRRRFDASDRPGQRARRVLETRAAEWAIAKPGDARRTLDEVDLAAVEKGRAGMRAWTAEEEQIVAASRVACAAESRARRWRRRAMVGGSVLVAVLGVAAGVGGVRAQREGRRATAAAIVSAAGAQSDPLDAVLLLASLADGPEPPGGLQRAMALATAPIPLAVTVGHERLDAARLSADGRTVVTRAYDVAGVPLARAVAGGPAVALGTARDTAKLVDVSADGRRALVAVRTLAGADSVLADSLVVRATNGAGPAVGLPHVCHLLAGGLTAAGARAWQVCDDGVLRVWRIDGAAHPTATVPLAAAGRTIRTAAVSADGRLVAAAFRDSTIAIRAIDGGGAPVVLDAQSPGLATRFSPDGARLAVISADGLVRLWPTAAATKYPRTLEGHRRGLPDIAFSPDGRSVATVSADSSALLWTDVDDERARPLALPHPDQLLAVAFTARGRSIVTVAADGSTREWRVEGSHLARRLPGSTHVTSVAFSPDGARVLSTTEEGIVRVQHADGTGDPVVIAAGIEPIVNGPNELLAAAFTPDGRRVLTIVASDTIRQWSAERTGVPPLTMSVAPRPPGDGHHELSEAAFSADGRRVITFRYADEVLRVRTVDGFGDTLAVPVNGATSRISLSPDGRSILMQGTDPADHHVLRLRRPDGTVREQVMAEFPRRVVFDPTGRLVAAAADRAAHVWHPDSARTRAFADDVDQIVDVALGRDTLVTVSADRTIRVRRADHTGVPLVLHAPEDVARVALSPDGRRLVTGGPDGVRVWLLRWDDAVAELARATTVCLSEEKRHLFLGESVADARTAWVACERAHGRTPPSR